MAFLGINTGVLFNKNKYLIDFHNTKHNIYISFPLSIIVIKNLKSSR